MCSPEAPGNAAAVGGGGDVAGVTPLGIWALAWPTMLVMGAGTIVRFADFGMVGDLGPEATAAVGVGGGFYWLIESMTSVGSIGVTAIVARAIGAGDTALASACHKQGQIQGIVLASIGCAIVFPLTDFAIGGAGDTIFPLVCVFYGLLFVAKFRGGSWKRRRV